MITRRNLLATSAAVLGAAALPNDLRALPKAKNLILVLASGGWDTTYALDPKPGVAGIDAPEGEVEEIEGIPIFTHASRPAVREFFGSYGSVSAVMRGVQTQSIVHSDCSKRVLTGTASDSNPDIGAITAFELGRALPAPYLVLGTTAYSGPLAAIATRCGTVSQIRGLLDADVALPPAEPRPARFVGDDDEKALMQAFLDARLSREAATRGQRGYNAARLDDFRQSLSRSEVLRGFSGSFGDDFEFTLSIDVQIGLALDAIQDGVSQVVQLEQAFTGWDTHSLNDQQTMLHQDLFVALKQLADGLSARKLLDNTVVAVLSEMGRTPLLNAAMGKDHWPVTSALVFGGGVKSGAYGGSGEGLEALNVDLATGALDPNGKQLSYANLAAGLLTLAGVDPAAYLEQAEAFRGFVA